MLYHIFSSLLFLLHDALWLEGAWCASREAMESVTEQEIDAFEGKAPADKKKSETGRLLVVMT